MRNQYPGICYRCGQRVEAKMGHFERAYPGWRVQHAGCAIVYRGTEVGKSLPRGEFQPFEPFMRKNRRK